MIPFILGGLFEVIGYICRIQSAEDPLASTPFILQTLMILLGPALMAATIYMILGRLIQLTRGDQFALIRRKWLTAIFVAGDVLSFITQTIGGVMITSSKGDAQTIANTKKNGKNIILGGLFIQIIFFGVFVLVSVLFQYRGRHYLNELEPKLAWKKHMYTLYVVSMLILVRSIVRVVEFAQGLDGYIYSHEVFLYVFDAAPMLIAVSMMNVIHPASISELLKETLFTPVELTEITQDV